MSRFKALDDFESRFTQMDLEELRHWHNYWTLHAQRLTPKVQKEALRRVYKIEKAIAQKEMDAMD